MTSRSCFIFAGPSLYGAAIAEQACASITWLPPVKRGDVQHLVAEQEPCHIAIVDGLFHQQLAVGHIELRNAVRSGWTIWGLSSMGAIRAYEMRGLGVRPFGRVYSYFLRHPTFRDDEVALLHHASAPYRCTSEPLIHIRVALEDQVAKGFLTSAVRDHIIQNLSSMWFGHRTLDVLLQLINTYAGSDDRIDSIRLIDGFQKYRIKSTDLADFVSFFPVLAQCPLDEQGVYGQPSLLQEQCRSALI